MLKAFRLGTSTHEEVNENRERALNGGWNPNITYPGIVDMLFPGWWTLILRATAVAFWARFLVTEIWPRLVLLGLRRRGNQPGGIEEFELRERGAGVGVEVEGNDRIRDLIAVLLARLRLG
jgi:hypothetical protein